MIWIYFAFFATLREIFFSDHVYRLLTRSGSKNVGR